MDNHFCAQTLPGQLAGTAKTEQVVVCLEHLGGWGRDVLDGTALGAELSAQLKTKLAAAQAGLLLIRKPGRAGQHRQKRWCYLAFIKEQVLERVEVSGPADLLTLDLSGPGKNGGQVQTQPLALVCAHGKRDRCCSKWGRSLATVLDQTCFYQDEVWESSHLKGHRFAPTMLVLPGGYCYGQLNAATAAEIIKAAAQGEVLATNCRGRICWDAPGQVAELAALQQQERAPIGAYQVGPVAFISPDQCKVPVVGPEGTTEFSLRRKEELVVASCGDEPKPTPLWQVDE